MKIAYIIFHDITKNDGVTKKVKGQIDEWRKHDFEVQVFCFLPNKGNSILDSQQFKYGGYLSMRFMKNKEFEKDINKFNPDIIYFRYDAWNINIIKSIEHRVSIAEVNSLDLNECKLLIKTEKTIKSVLRYFGYLIGRKYLLNKVSGIVGVTNEIIQHSSYKKYKKDSKVIPNGIDLNNFKPIKSNKIHTNRQSLFFIGTPNQPWHGLDVIMDWAEELKEFDFHIVGISGNNSSNLFFHGYLEKSNYLKILKKCQICIGSLALFRNEMEEACPLKVREYLAYGYPILLGYNDTAFMNFKPDFILEMRKQELFDYKKIREFVRKMENRIVTHGEIQNISTKNLESDRINFFEMLYNSKKKNRRD